MKNEIEIKLLVNQTFANFFNQEINNYQILQCHQRQLDNCYYDTHDHLFSQLRSGLRVRKENQQFIMTLKTAGSTAGGLHIRPEYNVHLATAEPDLTLLQQFAELQLPRPLSVLQTELQPIFRTDFSRHSWLLELENGSKIEVALDQGIISAKQQQIEIKEIEFELQQGCINDLLTFIQHLPLIDGIRLSAISKAERGYLLAGIDEKRTFNFTTQWQHLCEHIPRDFTFITSLFEYEQQLSEYTANLVPLDFINKPQETQQLLNAFYQLYQLDLQQLSLLDSIATQNNFETINQLFESNQRLYSNLQQLIKYYQLEQNNVLVIQRLQAIFHQARYVIRNINWLKLLHQS
ncbi:hypothetical protein CEP45_05080 [Mergibacter septicus]|uniref:CYTH domain-containing protein n=1 Tax=Mergibacter septicus TaxID=221402 RepID=UPI001C75781B|nr:CYTH domain-containing protein [Mergibacter septicus]QDJ13262.1 hypothetical protein CEP45_05080 [Mergibacter septicus]